MYNEKLAPPCHIVRNFPLHCRNNHISLQVYGLSFIIPAAKQIATVAQLVEQTIRNRQVMGSNPIGGSPKISGFSPESRRFRQEKPLCFIAKSVSRRFLKFLKGNYISATADSFLIDRQARALSRHHSSSIESSCSGTFSRLEKT
jgi:hypothetical protein